MCLIPWPVLAACGLGPVELEAFALPMPPSPIPELLAVLLEPEAESGRERVKLQDVAAIFMTGDAKYGRENWMLSSWSRDDQDEYWSAFYRHLDGAQHDAGGIDPDSGFPHRAHAVCNLLILGWNEIAEADRSLGDKVQRAPSPYCPLRHLPVVK